MRLLFLSDLNSIHTIRWANIFAEHGHDVHVASINLPTDPLNSSIKIHVLPFKAPTGYYLNCLHLKKLIKVIKPDVLNAHYASGFGTLARLSGFHPCVLSVWGSDVYDFPYESNFKMRIIQKNLDYADVICSTSHVMKIQTEKLLRGPKTIYVTPFGIDTSVFTPKKHYFEKVKIIGTVKTLAPKYGISTLIKAFALLSKMVGVDEDIQLVIAGEGSQKEELIALSRALGIGDRCKFLGKIPHEKVPEILHSFDIYVALSESESESFGVAILEASACGLPVVVSDAGGLPEVVINNETGLIVAKNDSYAAATAIASILMSPELQKKYGYNGIKRVEKYYTFTNSYTLLNNVFYTVIGSIER